MATDREILRHTGRMKLATVRWMQDAADPCRCETSGEGETRRHLPGCTWTAIGELADLLRATSVDEVLAGLGGKRKRCHRGHAYDDANSYTRSNGRRFCGVCNRERARSVALRLREGPISAVERLRAIRCILGDIVAGDRAARAGTPVVCTLGAEVFAGGPEVLAPMPITAEPRAVSLAASALAALPLVVVGQEQLDALLYLASDVSEVAEPVEPRPLPTNAPRRRPEIRHRRTTVQRVPPARE